jgi:hypothetical protein
MMYMDIYCTSSCIHLLISLFKFLYYKLSYILCIYYSEFNLPVHLPFFFVCTRDESIRQGGWCKGSSPRRVIPEGSVHERVRYERHHIISSCETEPEREANRLIKVLSS